MSAAEKIKKLFVKSNVTVRAEVDDRIMDTILRAFEKSKNKESAFVPNIGRIIMKSSFTKLAAAAAIIIAAVIGIVLFEKSSKPAWAIEQTIDILKNYNAIHFSGTTLDEQGKEVSFEAWARANKEQTGSDNFRLKTETGEIFLVAEHSCYRYDPQTQTVNITEGYGQAMGMWPGAKFLESMKEKVLDWQESYATDPATGRERVYVTCSTPAGPDPRSLWFEVDVESKLVISIKQWENMKREGRPSFYAQSITYLADLPDEMFHFETPEGAKTIVQLPGQMDELQDPNAGMQVGNMTEEQAAQEIARRYWQAIVDKDWDTVALLRPITTAEGWKKKYNRNFEKIVEIGQPYQEDGCKLGKIVPCMIKVENNEPQKVNIIVLFREINGQRTCVIAGTTWGSE
jgi:hypothetical protein